MGMIFKRAILDLDNAPTILWDNLLEGASVTGEGSNIRDPATNTYWTPSSLPATTTFDIGSSVGASYLGICSHNLYSTDTTLTLEVYTSTWTTVCEVNLTNNKSSLVSFNYTEGSEWRVTLSGSGSPSVGVMFLGKALQFDSGITQGYVPLYMSEDIELLSSRTITGQFMPNRVERIGVSTSFNLNILERGFVEGEDFQDFLRHYNDGGSFFFASSPKELRDDVSYCWRQGNTLKPSLGSLFYTLDMALEGFVD